MIKGYDLVKLFSETGYEESEKMFSTGNEELDELLERVYSAGIEDGYDYAQKEFSKKEKKDKKKDKKKKSSLSAESSGRGYGRSIILGGLPGAAGTYAGSREATQAEKEGADYSEIKDRATSKGALVGAVGGASLGLAQGLTLAAMTGNHPAVALGGAAGGALRGGLAGALGANKNTRERLRKSSERRYYEGND